MMKVDVKDRGAGGLCRVDQRVLYSNRVVYMAASPKFRQDM